MKLHQLPKTSKRSNKRLGRGYGSGKGGHTAGRGQKGQKTRGNLSLWFEGGQLPQIRRFPYIRGKGRFKSLRNGAIVINLSQLEKLPSKSTVDLKALVQHKLISQKELRQSPVKIVAQGKLTKALSVSVPVTQAAAQKIQAAGGKVISGSTD